MTRFNLITDPATRALAGALASSGPHAAQTIERMITHFSQRIETLEAEIAQCRQELAQAQATPAVVTRPAETEQVAGQPDGPTAKKRRLPQATDTSDQAWTSAPALVTLRALSFLAPRKKLDLVLTASGARLQRPDQDTLETGFAYARLRAILCLPTPARPKPHWTLVFLLQATSTADDNDVDAIACGFSEPVPGVESGQAADQPAMDKAALVALLGRITGYTVMEPSADVFNTKATSASSSGVVRTQPHVDCHLGARDGHLFFLSRCLFFGFRKPMLYLALDQIATVNVVGITSRTFNLRVTMKPNGVSRDSDSDAEQPGKVREFEFDMIDATAFDAIAGYVRQHHLDAPELAGRLEKEPSDATETGKEGKASAASGGAITISSVKLESSDEDDEDFCVDSDDSSEGHSEDDSADDDEDDRGSVMEE